MKKLFLTFLIVLGLASPSWAINLIAELPCRTDLADTKGVVSTGAIERVSGGTYIKDGVMQTARGNRTNLVERSHEFDNAWWSKSNVTITTGIADPDGGNNACYMKADATATESRPMYRQNVMDDNCFYILSIYTKKVDIDYLAFMTRSHGNLWKSSYFNLDTGAWNYVTHPDYGFSNEGDGWYRVWVMVDAESGATNDIVYIMMTSTDNVESYAGTLGEGIYIYGAQLEKLEGPSAPPGVELIADQVDRDFSGASDWTNTDIAAYDETGDLTITANAIGQFCTLAATEAPMTGYQAYILEFDVANIVATWTISDFDAGYEIGTISANGTNQQIVFSYADASSGGIRLTSVANNSSMDFDNVSLKEITFPGPLEPGTYTPTSGATATIPAEARFQDFGLLVEPGEGTNLSFPSNDFDDWTSTGNVTESQGRIGPTGEANTAWTLIAATAGAGSNSIRITNKLSQAAGTYTYSLFVKKNSGCAWSLMVYDTDNTAWRGAIDFEWTGMVLSVKAEDTGTGDVEQLGDTEWYRAKVYCPNVQANTKHSLYICPTEYTVAGTGSQVIYGNQFEATAYPTTYIPTTTCPVTRTSEAGTAANGVSWTTPQELKNILDDAEPGGAPTDSQGTLLFEVKWGCDESAFAVGSKGLISVTNSAASMAYFGQTDLVAADGTNTTTLAHPAFSAGDVITYAVRWGDVDGNADDISAGLREAEGTWGFDGTPANYDGAFTLGTKIRLAYSNSNIYPFEIRNIQFWDEAFVKNRQTYAGVGGTYSYLLFDLTDGGYFDGPLVTGANNTFENITIYNPFGIAFDADETCAITNCILYGYDKDIDIANTKTVTGKHNHLYHHTGAADNIGDGTYTNTSSVFATVPGWRGLADQDFHLLSNSSCRDAGFDTGAGTDLDGRVTPRGIHDIGGYEYYGGSKGRRSLLLGIW